MLLLMIVLSLMASGMRWARLDRTAGLWALLGVVLVAAMVRPGPLHLESLAIRYANFIGAAVLLNTYLFAGGAALSRDLFVILRWMALQAIATFVLANAAPFLFTPVQFGETPYQTLLLVFNYHELLDDPSGLRRPDGFFFEPGVFQIYLNIYLYLALFVFQRPRHVMLALAAVLTTQSTTGMLICVLLLAAAFVRRLPSGGLRQKLVAIAVTFVLAPPLGWLAYHNVQDKLTGESQGSSWAREYDFFTGINIISQYPVLGIGFDHQRYLSMSALAAFEESRLSEEGMEDRASSNGLIYLYYTLGIPLASVFFAAMFRQKFFAHRLLIGLLLSLSLFSEALVFTPFVLLIIFSAFVKRHRRRARLASRTCA